MSAARPPDPDSRENRALSPRARRLVDAAQATDRAGRFQLRWHRVREERDQWTRRSRVASAIALAALVVTGVAIGGWVAGLRGALMGLAAVVAIWALRHAVQRLAPRRGATAWDWRAERYRVIGDPSKEVQDLDQPRE